MTGERERETCAHSPVQRSDTARTSLALFFSLFFATQRQSEGKRRVSNEGRGIKAGRRLNDEGGEIGVPVEVKVGGWVKAKGRKEEEKGGEVERSHRKEDGKPGAGVLRPPGNL